MTKQAIATKQAPNALGPYTQAVRAGGTLYLSGQIGIDPAAGQLVEGVEAQAHQAFRNLRAVAEAAGGDLDDVVKVTVMLADLGDFALVNSIMAGYFREPYPARSAFQAAALPRGARIEIEAIAAISG